MSQKGSVSKLFKIENLAIFILRETESDGINNIVTVTFNDGQVQVENKFTYYGNVSMLDMLKIVYNLSNEIIGTL